MNLPTPNPTRPPNPWVAIAVIALSLVVLASGIGITTLQNRAETRRQIIGRDAGVLHAIITHQLGEKDSDELATILEASLQQGIIALRVFDGAGAFSYALPAETTDHTLTPEELTSLAALRPRSRFHPSVAYADLFLGPPRSGAGPLLELLIPLHSAQETTPRGFAQFLIVGTAIETEFRALDQRLLRQGILTFTAAGLLLAAATGWAFARLHQSNHLLEHRTRQLLAANQELATAARSSAIGAVTSHLLHGLKNPLSGLRHFLARPPADGHDTDWFLAADAAKRMQGMVSDVVRVIREAEIGTSYELSVEELLGVLLSRCQPLAQAAGVSVALPTPIPGHLSNRDANLLILILENLTSNAIQASPRGATVRIELSSSPATLTFRVADTGPGIPPELQPQLFSPVQSTKPGGGGIGLAISHQLSRHLHAELRLVHSSPQGSMFEVQLPIHHTRDGTLIVGNPPPAA